MRVAAWTALAAFALDQASKLWVLHGLNLTQRLAIDVVPPFLNFRMAWNRGINFGLFAGEAEWMRWLLVAVALGISAVVWLWVRGLPARPVVQVSAGLLVGGALGNALDRVLYGAVADFLNMSCCGWRNPWAFNIADVAIFAGAIGLFLYAGKPAPGDGGGANPP